MQLLLQMPLPEMQWCVATAVAAVMACCCPIAVHLSCKCCCCCCCECNCCCLPLMHPQCTCCSYYPLPQPLKQSIHIKHGQGAHKLVTHSQRLVRQSDTPLRAGNICYSALSRKRPCHLYRGFGPRSQNWKTAAAAMQRLTAAAAAVLPTDTCPSDCCCAGAATNTSPARCTPAVCCWSSRPTGQRLPELCTVVWVKAAAAYCTMTLPCMPAPWWGSQ